MIQHKGHEKHLSELNFLGQRLASRYMGLQRSWRKEGKRKRRKEGEKKRSILFPGAIASLLERTVMNSLRFSKCIHLAACDTFASLST